jgi:hypothetical protein
MAGNKALRRAEKTKDSIRIGGDVPLIVDTTELITPIVAQEMLKCNKANRPVNWNKVEEYSTIMKAGLWELHAQGVVFDADGHLLTGQKRLWAVVYSATPVYMRVSRGNPPSASRLLDRGTPQSARDLASRTTERKHSPVEASIARGVCVLDGTVRPSVDRLAEVISDQSGMVSELLAQIKGTKKTRSVVMILSAICREASSLEQARLTVRHLDGLCEALDRSLLPSTAKECWGRGAAFTLAMERARACIKEEIN